MCFTEGRRRKHAREPGYFNGPKSGGRKEPRDTCSDPGGVTKSAADSPTREVNEARTKKTGGMTTWWGTTFLKEEKK